MPAGILDLPLFVAAGLLLNLTPGADTLFIVSRAAGGGLRAGLLAALGIGAGCVSHALAAALGLSALLATSSLAFDLVKWVGAAYLAWLGLRMLLRAAPAPADAAFPQVPMNGMRTFTEGVLTNALNPKVALFFLAFVPQFIAPDAPAKPLAFLFLGAVFVCNGTLWCLLLAWLAARFGPAVTGSALAGRWLSRAGGALFIALGLRLALAGSAGRA